MISVKNLSKTYQLAKDNIVHALRDVSFEIKKGQISALIGPSGSGKSTMLHVLGGLDRDYTGTVEVKDKDIKSYDPNDYRRHVVQTIFQQFYLVPSFSVMENITLPITFGHQYSGKALEERAKYILETVGLYDRRDHKPNELSGGQAQRVAIARALMPNPSMILADEPTGNLDTKTGEAIMDLLFKINEEEEATIIVISHDMEVIRDVSNRFYLRDGYLVDSL